MSATINATEVRKAIGEVCDELRALLLRKNESYGNSALEPVRIFSKADPVEQLRVRIDDKLSRLAKGDDAGEDTEFDLLGYLVLLRAAKRLRSPMLPAISPALCSCTYEVGSGGCTGGLPLSECPTLKASRKLGYYESSGPR